MADTTTSVANLLATSMASTISATATQQLPSARESSQLSFLSIWWWIMSWIFFKLFGTLVYYIPAAILSILSRNFSITLSFSTLFLCVGILISLTWSIVRYKYLTLYSKLPSEPHRTEPNVDVFLNNKDDDSKSGFSSYLDEFLRAIRIFGYLEKPVFHELTRSMQTHKLEADEIMLLEEKSGFSIVVEGSIQVFAKANLNQNISEGSQFNNDTLFIEGERYHLLNEVKSGASLSSLFSILSLFTAFDEPPSSTPTPSPLPIDSIHESIPYTLYSLNEYPPDTEDIPERLRPSITPLQQPYTPLSSSSHQQQLKNNLPEIVARASVDSTIAVIPAESFKRLSNLFPKSVSHVLQMILAKLHRVTLQTAHSYLGLTSEIFQTEIKLNEMAKYELPSYLHDGLIKRLNDASKEQFISNGKLPNQTSLKLQDDSKFKIDNINDINNNNKYNTENNNSNNNNNNRSGSSIRRRRESVIINNNNHIKRLSSSRQILLHSKDRLHPGDLLTNVPLSRKETSYQSIYNTTNNKRENIDVIKTRMFSAEEETEDTSLRTALAEGIFSLLGINKNSIERIISTPNSFDSPSLSRDSNPLNQRFNNNANNNLNSNSNYLIGTMGNHVPIKRVLSMESMSSMSSSLVDDDKSNVSFETVKREFSKLMEITFYKKDSIIIKQNEPNPGLFYLVNGLLEVGFKDKSDIYRNLYTVKPGGLAGYLGSLMGYRSFVSVKAISDVYMGFISKSNLEEFCEKYYLVHLSIARKLTNILSKSILYMDFALEWVQTSAGRILTNQGDSADAIYIVLNGRFRSVIEENDKLRILNEFGQGDSIGEVEVLTATTIPYNLVAVRDSEVARLPRTLFENLALQYPSITIEVSRIVASKMRQQSVISSNQLYGTRGTGGSSISPILQTTNSLANYRTITILPVSSTVPVAEFGEKLVSAFKTIGRSVIALNQASILSHLGRHAFNRLANLKLSGYFSELEDRYQTVLYITDTAVNGNWTHTCIAQGDCVLLVADALSSPDIGDYERLLLKMRTTARTELVLIHSERFVSPGLTDSWLKNRIWVHSHHHVQMDLKNQQPVERNLSRTKLSIRLAKDLKTKVETLGADIIAKYRPSTKPIYSSTQVHKNDFNRLARILSGQAVGLVLGGGGARGIAHIGIIRTLEEFGIPVDLIGGTSIGSFVGGLYAKDYDLVPIYGRAKKFAGRISSMWRMALDLTYPATSYTTGHEFNRGIWKAFGDSRIEDFWLPFFANTTNITHSRMEIHTRGYAWRYIRASMSLAGLLPPITDSDGSMLLDGGYVDNLPVLEMKDRGASIILAVDVGSIDDRTPMSYGDSLSGVWVVFNRWNPFSKHPNVPSLTDIQSRLAYVSSVKALEVAKMTPGVLYIRPPVEGYGTLDFGRFEEIYKVAGNYCKELLEKWKKDGTLPQIPGAQTPNNKMKPQRVRRNSI